MAELKRCAHCGGKALVHRCAANGRSYDVTHLYIECEKCGIRTKVYATDKGAFNAWNRRADNG